MSFYAQIDQEGRVVALTEAESNPDEGIWLASPWDNPPNDFNDWLYIDGELSHDPRDLPPTPYSPEQVLSALLSATNVMDSLPDSALEHMAPYMAEWAIGASYAVGDLVQYAERPYRCLQGHTSSSEWNPVDAVSLWARVLAGQGDEVPVWEQPDSTNPYMTGDKVHYPDADGPIYESVIDNNIWSPEAYPQGWQLVEGGE